MLIIKEGFNFVVWRFCCLGLLSPELLSLGLLSLGLLSCLRVGQGIFLCIVSAIMDCNHKKYILFDGRRVLNDIFFEVPSIILMLIFCILVDIQC